MKIKKYGIYNCSDKALNLHRNTTNHDVVVVKKGLFHSKVKVLSTLAEFKDNIIDKVHYKNLNHAFKGELNPLCQKATGSKNYSGVFLKTRKVKNSDLRTSKCHTNIKVLRKYRKHLS